MRESLRSFWANLTKSRYLRYLEQENAFLKEELRRWQVAMLESKGLPSFIPHEKTANPTMKAKLMPSQWRNKAQELTTPKEVHEKN